MSFRGHFWAAALALSLLMFGNSLAHGTTLYASPQGTGTDCTQAAPCSLLSAKQKVRTINQAMASDIDVLLMDGVYELDAPLEFGPADSGFNERYVNYQAAPGAKPVLSGGTEISGWTLVDQSLQIYKAPAPNIDTRQLFVNGARAIRARSGKVVVTNPVENNDTHIVTMDIFVPNVTAWANGNSKRGVELVSSGKWTSHRCPLDAATNVAVPNSSITLQHPCGWKGNYGSDPATTTFWLENSLELLFAAGANSGQWYLNKDEQQWYIYYSPLPGENIFNAKIVAAGRSSGIEQLIVGKGTFNGAAPQCPQDYATTNLVQYLRFSGLTFAYSTWRAPNTSWGYVERQGGIHVGDVPGFSEVISNCDRLGDTVNLQRTGSAVLFSLASNIHFTRNQFLHLGGAALTFEPGSSAIKIHGNAFSDLSGGAIVAGEFQEVFGGNPAEWAMTKDIEILNNFIDGTGVEYHGAAAVLFMYGKDSKINNNEIKNASYSGISLGWGWNNDQTYASNNQVSWNYVHDVMQVMRDGGGIYTLGSQRGTSSLQGSTVTRNYIKNVGSAGGCHAIGFSGYVAIYHDNGSSYFTDEDNVIENDVCSSWILVQNKAPACATEPVNGVCQSYFRVNPGNSMSNSIRSAYVALDVAWCKDAFQFESHDTPACKVFDLGVESDQNSFGTVHVMGSNMPTNAANIVAAAGITPAYADAKNVRVGPLYQSASQVPWISLTYRRSSADINAVIVTSVVGGQAATCTASAPGTDWNATFQRAAGSKEDSSPITVSGSATFTMTCNFPNQVRLSRSFVVQPVFDVQLTLSKANVIGSETLTTTTTAFVENANCTGYKFPAGGWGGGFGPAVVVGQPARSTPFPVSSDSTFIVGCESVTTKSVRSKLAKVTYSEPPPANPFDISISVAPTRIVGSGSVEVTTRVFNNAASCNLQTTPSTSWWATGLNYSFNEAKISGALPISSSLDFYMTCTPAGGGAAITKTAHVDYVPYEVYIQLLPVSGTNKVLVKTTAAAPSQQAVGRCTASTSPGTTWWGDFDLSPSNPGLSGEVTLPGPTVFSLNCNFGNGNFASATASGG